MLEIAQKSLEFYTKYFKAPSLEDLKIETSPEFQKPGCVFVTLYKNGEIRGGAGNVKEIKTTLAEEIIYNTIEACSKDKRFSPVSLEEQKNISIRLDIITERKVLKESEINNIEPTKQGVIAIKKDYSNLAVILPNIDPKILTGEDFIPIIKSKLQEKNFDEQKHILYAITTSTSDNI